MTKRKYDYFLVTTPDEIEIIYNYNAALRFYGKSEKPSTLFGVNILDINDNYTRIKAK